MRGFSTPSRYLLVAGHVPLNSSRARGLAVWIRGVRASLTGVDLTSWGLSRAPRSLNCWRVRRDGRRCRARPGCSTRRAHHPEPSPSGPLWSPLVLMIVGYGSGRGPCTPWGVGGSAMLPFLVRRQGVNVIPILRKPPIGPTSGRREGPTLDWTGSCRAAETRDSPNRRSRAGPRERRPPGRARFSTSGPVRGQRLTNERSREHDKYSTRRSMLFDRVEHRPDRGRADPGALAIRSGVRKHQIVVWLRWVVLPQGDRHERTPGQVRGPNPVHTHRLWQRACYGTGVPRRHALRVVRARLGS